MRFVLVSLVVHALVLCLFVRGRDESPHVVRAEPITTAEEAPMVVEMIGTMGGGGGGDAGGGGGAASAKPTTRAAHIGSTRARSVDPWAGLSVRTDDNREGNRNTNRIGDGNGIGNGDGNGIGNGIGFGNGGGVHVERDVPPPPPPPPPSKARPAKLIWPTRDLEVDDESALFVAKVTVDTDGSVVGARMLTNRPGSRADHAANAIWTFRYEPALDDNGVPIRSTFEQSFQVR